MMTSTVRASMNRLQSFLVDRLSAVPIMRDFVKREWTSIATFLMLLPYQLFYFIWLLTGGPSSEFGFLHRYISYLHLFVYICSIGVARVAIEPSVQNNSGPLLSEASITESVNDAVQKLKDSVAPAKKPSDIVEAIKDIVPEIKSKPKSI